jgi:hypothetical protein
MGVQGFLVSRRRESRSRSPIGQRGRRLNGKNGLLTEELYRARLTISRGGCRAPSVLASCERAAA